MPAWTTKKLQNSLARHWARSPGAACSTMMALRGSSFPRPPPQGARYTTKTITACAQFAALAWISLSLGEGAGVRHARLTGAALRAVGQGEAGGEGCGQHDH